MNSLILPYFRIVDFGCGRGAHTEDPVAFRRDLRNLRGKAAAVIGLDVDSAARSNPTVDEFRLLQSDGSWPLADGSANMVLCDMVLEHLQSPGRFFDEALRVLASEGYLCIRTPNAISYVGIASRIVPDKFRNSVLKTAQAARQEQDVFPTLYRCNTISALRKQLSKRGFRSAVYGYDAEPRYLDFSKLAYFAGVLHQRFAPRFLRPTIFAFCQSPHCATARL